MPMKPNREYRNMILEVMDDDDKREDRTVAGYASTFNEPYTLFEDDEIILREQVAPEAFVNADMADVIMQYNHEGRVFARVSNNTLRLQTDDKGLFILADLGGTEIGRELYEEIRGGYTNKMSFGFVVAKDRYDEALTMDGKQEVVRTIESIQKVFDVSAVSLPANDGTSISIRNLSDGVIQRVKAERLEAERIELERKRLQLRIRAMEAKK